MSAHPDASQRVKNAIEAGDSPLLWGFAAAHQFSMEWRKGRGKHRTFVLYAGDREVHVHVSPSGRKVRVFVDGQERL